MTLRKDDFQAEFKLQLASTKGGELAKRCFDCGTCTAVCPVSESGTGFDPRKILHMVKLGLKERLLGSDIIWHCSHCDSCALACPQGVRFSIVVDKLREMALTQGYVNGGVYARYGTAPCKADCPAHISIPGFIGAIVEGRHEEGLKLIKEQMPFPAICGRICPHPCESRCNRGKVDEPVAIKFLKRFLADKDILKQNPCLPKKKQSKQEKVAVIGAGPAGLTAGYYLAIEGYPVRIFEKLPISGGMMAVGIPEFRLPRDILQAEIDILRRLDIDIQHNVELGRDFTLQELQDEYQAIFIGTGCHQSQKLGIPNEDRVTGITDGLTFLREVNLGNPPSPGKSLTVIGGGNTAVDCARVAKRLGYQHVTILYRRTREEMPAGLGEVKEAMEEGIDVQFLTSPVRILEKDGKVCGLECVHMRLGAPDESGRKRPIPVNGPAFKVEADTVISAIGQVPDLRYLTHNCGIVASQRGLLQADPLTGATNIAGVFAGGDLVSGPRTVVEAVASGKRAAESIDLHLRGKSIHSQCITHWKGMNLNIEVVNPEPEQRQAISYLPTQDRKHNFKEIEMGFTEDQACKEAGRCLRICGTFSFSIRAATRGNRTASF